jgi:hypothetical protein
MNNTDNGKRLGIVCRMDLDGEYCVKVVADNSGKFCGNGVTFDTVEDAAKYGADLAWRWIAVRQWAVFVTKTGERVTEVHKA